MNDSKINICYEDFGAVGDGITDDFAAIIKAHEYANEKGLPVAANPTKTYYIGSAPDTALIMTDTDWGMARFIIDDTGVTPENREPHVFKICSGQAPVELDAPSVKKGQMMLGIKPGICLGVGGNAFVVAVDENSRQFMRVGLNQEENGYAQTDWKAVVTARRKRVARRAYATRA